MMGDQLPNHVTDISQRGNSGGFLSTLERARVARADIIMMLRILPSFLLD
jgi:hypothetical protein